MAQKAEMELNERLRTARIKAGYSSAAEAARRLGLPYGTYSGHENGLRGIKRDEIVRYARAFGISRTWLEYGEEWKYPNKDNIEVLGEAGSLPDAEVRLYGKNDPTPLILLPRIIDVNMSALHVCSKGLVPYAYSNYMLLFASVFTTNFGSAIGSMSVCITNEQKLYIRRPYNSGLDSKFDLEFPNMETMRGVVLDRVSPIIVILTEEGYRSARAENMVFADKLDALAISAPGNPGGPPD